ncbi:hypothetical protein ABTL50_19700, partial [Acinetobacter baumannii]
MAISSIIKKNTTILLPEYYLHNFKHSVMRKIFSVAFCSVLFVFGVHAQKKDFTEADLLAGKTPDN